MIVLAITDLSIAFTSAIVLTAVYGLIAIGFVIIYRASGVLNFAHGAMMVLGGFLGFGHEMADRVATMHSHELLMRDVAPVFKGSVERQQAQWERLQAASGDWGAIVGRAQDAAFAQYEAERGGS